MSYGVLDRKREMEYTQRHIAGSVCTVRIASPEEINKILSERGNQMGKRGPKPGFKRDKRVNVNELADKAVIQASKKKDLADAARNNIEAEIDAIDTAVEGILNIVAPGIQGAAPVTKKADSVTEKTQKVTSPLADWDVLAAQTKGAVLQERDNKMAKSIDEAVEATRQEKHGMGYAEFRAKQAVPNTKEDIGAVLTEAFGHAPSPELVSQIRHERICQELTDLYVRKNHDYGNSFNETYRKLGIISAVTRITDKVNRIQSLCTKEQKIHDESIRDTLVDLANYAIMTIMEMEAQG